MKRMIVIVCTLTVVLIAIGLLSTGRSDREAQELSQTQFVALLQSNLLTNVRVYEPAKPGRVDGVSSMLNQVRGTFYASGATKGAKQVPFVAKVRLTPELTDKVLSLPGVSVVSPNPVVQQVKSWFHRSTR